MKRVLLTICALLAWTSGLAGCAPFKSKLLADHTAPQRKEKAQQQWDSVRADVKLQLAKQHLAVGRLDEAEKTLDQAVATAPSDPQAFLLLTRLRLEQGRLAEAREAVSAALALSAKVVAADPPVRDADPEVFYFAGVVAQRYNDLERAAELYASAARRAPNVVAYVLAYAETLAALDRPMDALELLERRMNDFDTSAPMRLLGARVCRNLGLRGPAAAHAREAVRLDPQPTVAAEAGQILVWAERFSDAVGVLAPLLVDAGPRQGGPSAAADISAVQTIRPIPPGEESLRRSLAAAYFRLGRPDQAMASLAPALCGDFAAPATSALYARAAIAAGDLSAAARALDRSRERGPELLLLAAYVAFQSGDFTSASEKVDLAIAHENPATKPRGDEATKLLSHEGRTAAQDDRALLPAYLLKGRSAEAAGRLDDARRAYGDALALDPASKTAAACLARLESSYRCEDPVGKTLVPGLPAAHSNSWRPAP